VGGQFTNFGGDPRMDYLVRWDGSAWNPVGNLTQTNGSLDAWVNALAVDGTDLYVGGYFTSASNEGVSVSGATQIAKWDGSTWSALGGGLNTAVWTLAVDASHNVYAGGSFTDAASIPEADYVAKWNGSAWSALAGNGSGDGALNGSVYALATNGANVYVGGGFTTALDTSNTAIPNAPYFAKWSGSAWSAMDGILSPLDAEVYALEVSGSDLYVGGAFLNLNGMDAADRIAKWDGTNWSGLGDNGSGGGSIGNYISAIAVKGNHVYVGGIFTNIINSGTTLHTADFVAKWDGSNWSALGSDGSGNGSLNSSVYALKTVNNDLWVGGIFVNVNNGGTVIKEADYLAVFGADLTLPTVTSINRVNATPASAASVDFTVTFSESVTGVDTADFTLTTSGVSGATVSGVAGSGASYTVTVNTGSGNGTIRLDLNASGTGIKDTANLAISGGFTGGQVYDIDKNVPTVLSINRVNATPTKAASVAYTVTFSRSVTGVDAADFIVTMAGGVSVATVSGVSGSGTTRTVTVNTGSGSGTLRLDLKASGTGIVDTVGNAISGGFTSGQVYTVDKTAPTVLSIVRAETNPTAAAALDFTVTFSESVSGVDATDFIPTMTGSVAGAVVTADSGSGATRTVTVNSGSGNGTLRLDLKASGTAIVDALSNPIGGGFTGGQVYNINKTLTFKSVGANDGWILESTETSAKGGTMNSSATTFNLGDSNQRKQYRAILHFDTSALPDNAVITKVTLKIKKQGLAGTDPFTILGGLTVDMRRPSFGALALALTDFQASAPRVAVSTFGTTPVANWYSAILNASGRSYVNKTGTTQFRLRFATDDNNNAVADFMRFFSGSAAAGARPQLIVEYKVP
jgi:hypothetical protein